MGRRIAYRGGELTVPGCMELPQSACACRWRELRPLVHDCPFFILPATASLWEEAEAKKSTLSFHLGAVPLCPIKWQ